MTLYISHNSALQLLISQGTPQRRVLCSGISAPLKPTRAQPRPGMVPNWSGLKEWGMPDGVLTNRLHINVADAESRVRAKGIVCHVWPAPECGSYLKVDDVYCVQTPEACFAQLAADLELPQLVELAMMLCGTFAPAPEGLATRYNLEPLTTPKKLAAYVGRLKGRRGLDKARIAAKLAAAGAGSPMEAKIAAAISLSTRQGGYGMPALLNHELKLTDAARGLGFSETRRPDFYWPRYSVSLDYDSSEYHDERQRAEADERRRNELAALGIIGIVARSPHVSSLANFEALMRQVFAAMGRKGESRTANLDEKRARMYALLFGRDSWNPMDVR